MVKAGYVLEVLEFITEEEGELFLYEQKPFALFPPAVFFTIFYSI